VSARILPANKLLDGDFTLAAPLATIDGDVKRQSALVVQSKICTRQAR
jgi:hypothetical protein